MSWSGGGGENDGEGCGEIEGEDSGETVGFPAIKDIKKHYHISM
jgi:hypothetical protein